MKSNITIQQKANQLLKTLTLAQAISVSQNMAKTSCPNAFNLWNPLVIYLQSLNK